MNVREIPLVFGCEGCDLVGMVHMPEAVRTRGLLWVNAGGPQYRGGMCRMQVDMARTLANAGTPVMRFDYRGMGDSEGEFRGFRDIEADLRAALATFAAEAPEISEFVLWGGCDAATAIVINAWKFPQVTGVVLGNPWVHSQATATVVEIEHYWRRWKDRDLWRKVLCLQYNPLPALRTVITSTLSKAGLMSHGISSMRGKSDDATAPYLERMQNGLSRYRGDMLMLMSGRSLFSREFDVLVNSNLKWQAAFAGLAHKSRHDLPDADQAFSTISVRAEVCTVTAQWLHDKQSIGWQEFPT